MDEYIVEIDELREDLVVLSVPVLRLLVFGRKAQPEDRHERGCHHHFRSHIHLCRPFDRQA